MVYWISTIIIQSIVVGIFILWLLAKFESLKNVNNLHSQKIKDLQNDIIEYSLQIRRNQDCIRNLEIRLCRFEHNALLIPGINRRIDNIKTHLQMAGE